ncbi:MAG: response regulator transcription factor [Rickettsiaceae bacterium]|nr:response regulator transcription factor [Rickettsiaceae bacterium]
MNHILIVDDDSRILKLLKKFLSQSGYLVSTSNSATEAINLLSNFSYDLIILDVMMPEVTGPEFARQIKDSGSVMPIVMLTALSEPEDKIKGLESGANDYITKPFEPRELLLRINNLINSHSLHKKEQELVMFGNNRYNLITKELVKDDAIIKLSSSESKLLDSLLDSANQVISREELAQKTGTTNPRSIDVQIVRLRSKIENDPKTPQFLKTIRSKGYVLYT